MRRLLLATTMLAMVAGAATAQTAASEWRTYGHDKGGQRFSPLTQITPQNVGRLQLAWSYKVSPAEAVPAPAAGGGRGPGGRPSEQTPLVIDGVMYFATTYGKVIAVDAASGKEMWVAQAQGPARAMEYWPGDATHAPALIFPVQGGLMSLDAKTGKPSPGFGTNGQVTNGGTGAPAAVTLIHKNIIVSAANPNKDGRDEDIRAFDAATGKQLWRFNTIPKAGEPGFGTWPADYDSRMLSNSAVGMWGQPTVDEARGILYILLDSPQWERWGGDRLGDNLFGNSVVALDINTGKHLWHYQIVHHDLWDLDLTGNPVLFDVKQGGRTIPAVSVVGKGGIMFMFDRVTGKPIYDVVETPVAKSEAPGEVSSPTQPIPSKPVGVSRTSFKIEDLAQVTPEHTAACKKMIEDEKLTFGGPYNPPGFANPTVQFPGANGAGNYGGMTMLPNLGYIVINTQDLGQITRIGPRGTPLRNNGTSGVRAPANATAVPYDMVGFNGRFAVMQPVIMPCQAPPWGSLTAVNVNTGDIAWQVPLGVTDSLPEGKKNTGRPNLGGPISTASGLVFIGASDDNHFRAFDARNGKIVWDITMPTQVKATPITYADKAGKQYVTVATGDTVYTYALR